MTLNCGETNVGKIKAMWNKPGYVKAIGEHRGERVWRDKLIGKRCTRKECRL